MSTSSNYGENYTGSPCVDGVLLNVKSAGCETASIYTVPMTRTTRVQCTEREEENPWTTYTFYMIPEGDSYVRDGMKFLCSDPMFVVTFTEE